MSEFARAGLEIWLVWRPEAPTVAAAALRRRGGYLWPLAVTPVTNSSGSVGFGPSTVRMARVPPQTVPLEPLHDQNRPISLCCTPTKRARGGRVTALVTARAGAVFDGSEPFASGTRAHDQKVANYEPVVPIYEVVKTALVACPIKVAVSEFRGEKKGKLGIMHRNSAILA